MRLFFSRLFLVTALTLLLLSTAAPVFAASGNTDVFPASLSVDEYWGLVDHSLQVVGSLKKLSAGEIKIGLEQLAIQWDAVAQVNMSDGQVIPVDNSYLLSLLRADQPDLSRIENILSTLQVAHKNYPSKIFSTADLNSLTQILLLPEFQWKTQTNPLNDWFHKQWDRFMKWLNGILGDRAITIPSVGLSPLAVIATLLLVLVLVYVFRSLFADLINEASINGNGEHGDELLTSDVAFKRAQTLSQGGDYRSAVRYLYLSSLLLLDERGLLRYDHSKTNREYLRSVSDSPELSEPLKDVIDVFDNVWYGYHELDEDSFKHYSDRVEELKEKKQ